ncbi:DUF402 domain-containing protein [Streptomyces sp. NPDC005773]|uniref:DUF402 domain-containing protein n=1 Tax=Streptomyces sp. NPDC005773 TaxID=3364727 RepID=UPI00367364E5
MKTGKRDAVGNGTGTGTRTSPGTDDTGAHARNRVSSGLSDEPGQILHWNFFIGGHLSASVPVRLVERTPEGQLVWMETGTPMWCTALPRGATHLRDIAPHERPAEGYPVVAGRWPMGSALFYQPTGAAHSVLWLFDRRQKFRGWYVNLERRVHHGADIDIADHELDINVAPDRTWQWKDEDSFAEKTGHPAYWNAEEAMAIRTEGNRVARLAEAGTFPFDGSWCDFRPPPAWRTPPRPPVPRHPLLTPAAAPTSPHVP